MRRLARLELVWEGLRSRDRNDLKIARSLRATLKTDMVLKELMKTSKQIGKTLRRE